MAVFALQYQSQVAATQNEIQSLKYLLYLLLEKMSVDPCYKAIEY